MVLVATEKYGISRATIFRMLAAGELVRYRRRGSTATMIGRRLLRPRPEKGDKHG
jgi:hypothetical protein